MAAGRKAQSTEARLAQIARLREACLGCDNCTGICHDLLEFAQLPQILLARREARA